MQRLIVPIGVCCLFLGILSASSVYTEEDDGPFGLRWGMSKEDVEKMSIRLCCQQLGKWGLRYQVNTQDFQHLPKRLGDEEKMYLYFGQENKLLRTYVSISKIGGLNRFNQINILLAKRYDVVDTCEKKGRDDSCHGYERYTTYKKGEIHVDVGFEENLTYRDKIFVTLLNTSLHKDDGDKKNPF